jgi:hypothetical protein
MAGRSRFLENADAMSRTDERATRKVVAWARGADTTENPTSVIGTAPSLGPYEIRYDVCRGYCTEREIIRP